VQGPIGTQQPWPLFTSGAVHPPEVLGKFEASDPTVPSPQAWAQQKSPEAGSAVVLATYGKPSVLAGEQTPPAVVAKDPPPQGPGLLQVTVTVPVVKFASQAEASRPSDSVKVMTSSVVAPVAGHVKIVWFVVPASLLFGSVCPFGELSVPPVVVHVKERAPGFGPVAPATRTSDWPSAMTALTGTPWFGKNAVLPAVPESFTLRPASSEMFVGFATIEFQTGQLLVVALTRMLPESRPWLTTHCMLTATVVVVRFTTEMFCVLVASAAGNEQVDLPSSVVADSVSW
jgi:hypothetical protein